MLGWNPTTIGVALSIVVTTQPTSTPTMVTSTTTTSTTGYMFVRSVDFSRSTLFVLLPSILI